MTSPVDLPLISVIIAVRPGRSCAALAQLQEVDYPADRLEILLAEGYCPPRQRNEGVRRSAGQIVYFLDDDSLASPDLFRRVAARFHEAPHLAAVGGPSLTPPGGSLLQRNIARILASPLGAWTMRARYSPVGRWRTATEKELIGCNLGMRRAAFIAEGGFNERFFPNEETELLARLKRRGHKLAYDPAIVVWRGQRESVGALGRQFFPYGCGRMRQILARPQATSLLFLLPLFLCLYLLALPFLPGRSWMWLLPLALYGTLATVESVRIMADGSQPCELVLLLLLFAIVHLCYGLGLLWGLMEWAPIRARLTNERAVPTGPIRIQPQNRAPVSGSSKAQPNRSATPAPVLLQSAR